MWNFTIFTSINPHILSDKQIFTLSQVARSIRKTIEQRYAKQYWVKAEMHKLNLFASGHAFPELVEKVDDKIVAQFSGVIWKTSLQRINKRFVDLLNEPLREGGTFLLQVHIQYSEVHGVSLNIMDIDPDYSLGELQRERKETLERLEKEGLLRKNQQLPFPRLPKRVAIISAETSKGLSDFMEILTHNKEQYVVDTFLFPSYMQGDVAIPSISKKIEKINKHHHLFDIVVIVRGGGGEIGMSCYNNYSLCKTIASCKLPVLTGIGHSTNFTVAEMIAHQNAITPSELAESILKHFRREDQELLQSQRTVIEMSLDKLFHSQEALSQQRRQIIQQANLIIEYNKRFQTKATHGLAIYTRKTLQTNENALNNISNQLQLHSQRTLFQQKDRLERMKSNLLQLSKQQLLTATNALEQNVHKLTLLDPINVLRRGYSIVLHKGKTVSQDNLPESNDEIQIETANFILNTKVVDIKENERK